VKTPRLADAHRILIVAFAVFSALFGVWALIRARRTGDDAATAFGLGSLAVSVGCLVYLRRSRYLHR
jgi:hypothetical protein